MSGKSHIRKPSEIELPLILIGASAPLNEVAQHCLAWDDFKQHLSGLSEKQKGDLFEELVKAYRRL